MRVIVTQIASDGTMRRRMIDPAGRDAGRWQELIARALMPRCRTGWFPATLFTICVWVSGMS